MKCIFTILFCLAFTASVQARGSDSAIRFHIAKDPRKWTPPYMQRGSDDDIIEEFVPEGDSSKTWKETVSIQVAFTTVSLRKYVDTWKDMLLKTDSKIDLKEETIGDDSIIVTHTSPSADETSIRRFFKGKDGVYMLAYHVRPKFKKDETFKIWGDINRTATLIPNSKKDEIASQKNRLQTRFSSLLTFQFNS